MVRGNILFRRHSGVMVSVLAIGLKVRGFKFDRGDRLLRAIKSVVRLPSEGK
jgi:hypothetical protein